MLCRAADRRVGRVSSRRRDPHKGIVLDAHELADLLDARAARGSPWLEFVRSPDLSVGLYVLAAGAADLQSPHAEDEVYWIVSGRGRITVGTETRPVRAGSVVFVGATVPHRFHDISEDLVILVAFGPAEGSRASTFR